LAGKVLSSHRAVVRSIVRTGLAAAPHRRENRGRRTSRRSDFQHPIRAATEVTAIDAEPAPEEIGTTLHHCHRVLRGFKEPLPELGILFETLELLETPASRTMLSASEIGLLWTDWDDTFLGPVEWDLASIPAPQPFRSSGDSIGFRAELVKLQTTAVRAAGWKDGAVVEQNDAPAAGVVRQAPARGLELDRRRVEILP
jgi:hypothetical protein